jgi:tRNA pseudouridine32 synthase / 23S rRNA pseudouridine746 synthase
MNCRLLELVSAPRQSYLHDLLPIALAEFWWGKSPNSEVRKHGYFYPSCRSKCLPILTHMLEGLTVDPNPLADNPANVDSIDIVYDDDHVVVVNKPFDFLSVPGRSITDSVFTRIKLRFPKLKELMTVHRLDMSTSGLMLICKTKQAHKHIQLQFLHRTIKKRYIAILDGILEIDEGVIDLPLRVNIENRPRQLVCHERGKPSVTSYKVLERKDGKTRIHFFPHTGRTHQLRMHASHELGLNIPILGDDLYGKRADRLYLHAEGLSFDHPVSGERIELEVKAAF